MEEFIGGFVAYTFFGSAVWFAVVALALLFMLFVSDVHENGFIATASVVIVIIGNYVWGNFPILDYISVTSIGLYLAVGFGFSILRTVFKGRELTAEYEEETNNYKNDWSLAEHKKKFDLKGHVFRWLFMFPVSMLTWFFGSICRDFWNLFYSKFGKMYERLLNL